MGCATLDVEACDGESDAEAESEVLADADAETPGGMDRFGAAAGLGVLHAADTPAAIAITAPTIACRHMPIPAPGVPLVALIRARKCTPYWRGSRPLPRICRDQRSAVDSTGRCWTSKLPRLRPGR